MSQDDYVHLILPGQPGGPLLFVFHGTGGSEQQFPTLGRELLPTATIVSPRGDVSEHGAARFFRRTAEGVYDMEDLARAARKMAGFVSAHVERAGAEATFALGYSNGANILAATLFLEPDLFDRVVLMHPLIPFEPHVAGSIAGKPVLVTAGRRDPICPTDVTSRLIAHLRGLEADVVLEWHEGGHEIRTSEIDAARRFLSAGAKAKGDK
jgi:phospholipase/carboxylesterase